MLVTQEAVQQIQQISNTRAALLLAAIGVIVFWRAALRVLLATVILAATVGAAVLVHGMR